MGRNHITEDLIECVSQKTVNRSWRIASGSLEKMMDCDPKFIPSSDEMFPYDSFLLTIWNGLGSRLKNPYPLGTHIAIVPEFGFTKRDLPVKFSRIHYVERIELKNSIYSMWCTDSKGFVVTVGTEIFSGYGTDRRMNGIPVVAFGDADDFADYLMEFDSYVPRIDKEHQGLVTRMMTFLKANEMLGVAVRSSLEQQFPQLGIKKLYLKDDNAVRYVFEHQGDSFHGECMVTELMGRIRTIAHSVHL